MQKSMSKAVSSDGYLINLSGLKSGNNTAISIGGTVASSDSVTTMECPVNHSMNGLNVEAASQQIQDLNISCSEDPWFQVLRSGVDLSNQSIGTILLNETMYTRPARDEDPLYTISTLSRKG